MSNHYDLEELHDSSKIPPSQKYTYDYDGSHLKYTDDVTDHLILTPDHTSWHASSITVYVSQGFSILGFNLIIKRHEKQRCHPCTSLFTFTNYTEGAR